jgi:hypothetical protein
MAVATKRDKRVCQVVRCSTYRYINEKFRAHGFDWTEMGFNTKDPHTHEVWHAWGCAAQDCRAECPHILEHMMATQGVG